MESLERKDASTGPEEPIKSEGIVPSPDTNSERSNGASSPPPNCSICLGHLVNTSFTDSCLHQFCFTCLLQWSKIKTECPLCKQTFKSIIHNVRSEGDYDQYPVHMYAHQVATLDVTADIHISGQWDVAVGVGVPGVPARPFMYRTTMGANRRYGMILNPEAVANREQIPSIAPQISSEERRRRNANPIDYRRTVYRHGIWAASLPDAFGRFRESSAEYYRRHPAEVNRLVPWLNRELQVLLNNNRPHIAYVMRVITDILTQFDIHSAEFRNVVRVYFGIYTDHFVHELSIYARTNFDLVGYDQNVSYLPNRGLSNEYVQRAISPTPSTSSSSSTDSEVRVLNDNFFDFPRLNAYHMPSAGPHIIDMPGPSTVGHAFRLLPSYTVPDVLTISSTSSSSENECEVIGYVKPRHERTPEIIDLSSSEVEEVNTASQSTSNETIPSVNVLPLKDEEQPSTSSYCGTTDRRTRRQTEDAFRAQMYEYLDSTSESDSEESDSDYKPASSKSRRYKSTSKKASKSTARKLRSRKRKKSTVTLRKRDKESRNRYSSDGSDNESPDREPCTSRGTKRYHSKSSEASESEKISKKNKKNKKSKSSKKSKKRSAVSSSSSKSVICRYSNSSSSSSSSCSACNSDTEAENKSTRRRKKKSTSLLNSYPYSSEEPSATEKSSPKSSRSSSSRRASTRKHSIRFPDSDLFNYHRSGSSRRSSNSSFDSHPAERLQELQDDNNRDTNRRYTSDEEEDKSHDHRSSSSYSDVVSSSYPNKESDDKSTAVTTSTTTTGQTSSHSSERLSASTSSACSSKSDASTRTEHSVSSKTSRDRHRSYKKRKDLKKRRRSRS